MPPSDPFALLGLPRAFRLEPEALARAAREQARGWHPDRFARATPHERRLALSRATAVNDARRALARWTGRAAALLALAAPPAQPPPEPPAATATDAPDHAFLEAQLTLRETLASARAAGDPAALGALADDVRARLAALEAEAAAWFDDPAWPERHAGALGRLVTRARFLEAVLADAEREADRGPW